MRQFLSSALTEREKALDSEKAKDANDAAKAIEKKIDTVKDGTRSASGLGPLNRDLARLATSLESADVRPSETAHAAVDEACKALDTDLAAWRDLNTKDVVAFNTMLEQLKLASLPVTTSIREGTGWCRSGK